MRSKSIAIYMRLSMSDEARGGDATESGSIANQRGLINRFLDGHSGLSQLPRTEFFDDGFTGTNTDRPAFKKMMERVKRGDFGVICVKDFSRFSRDYIETGDCLECLFPFLNVRFISINDGYDSDNYRGSTGGTEMVIKSMIYSAYSKDLSVKTSTAKLQRIKKGEHMGGHAPYGFVSSTAHRNRLAVDPESARTVRRIFHLAAEGRSAGTIAGILNEEKALTPGQYFVSKHPDTGRYSFMSKDMCWTGGMVRNILTNRVYTGAAVGMVYRQAAPLSKKKVRQPEEDRIIVEDAHEAIVSRREFELAQAVIKRRSEAPKRTERVYPLRSLIRCGICGRMMEHTNGGRFYCKHGAYSAGSPCDPKVKYSEAELEATAFNAIRLFMSIADTGRAGERPAAHRNIRTLAEAQRQEHRLKEQKLKLYERYSEGGVSREEYRKQRQVLDGRLREASEQIAAMEKAAVLPTREELDSSIKQFSQETALTPELAQAFIKAVYVFPDGRREIEWRFRDIAGLLNAEQ